MCLALIPFIREMLGQWRKSEAPIVRALSLAAKSAGIPAFRRPDPRLAFELGRARRYQRPLAVVVLSLGDDQVQEQVGRLIRAGGNGNGDAFLQLITCAKPLVSFLLGSILREALREGDVVSYDAVSDRYAILLTEVNNSQARQAVERLDDLLYKRTFVHFRAGIAEFPSDGLTLEDLVSHAQTAGWHQPKDQSSADLAVRQETVAPAQ